jgi:hypothetical protein
VTALRVLGWIWSLPVTLVGVAVFAFCAPRRPRWRRLGYHGAGWIIEVELGRWPYDAGTFGVLQGYKPGQATNNLRRHEDVHTLQGFVLGPLNLVVYGACWAALFVYWIIRLRRLDRALRHAYRDNPLEEMAYRWQERP